MFRYVAFVWNDAEVAERETAQRLIRRLTAGAPEWQISVRRGGLAVFHAGARAGSLEPRVLSDGTGVVLGTLFSRASGSAGSVVAPQVFTPVESAEILKSQGRRLIECYWGRYVAFLHDPASKTSRVLRDPTATLPCFAMNCAGVDVYFSWMEDAIHLVPAGFSVDLKYLAAALCYPAVQLNVTGLKEISQVLGGECVARCGAETRREFYWNMLRVAETEVFEDAAEAAEALRRGAHDCVAAWASCYDRIVLTLSGGLDSSIVLACLQDIPAREKVTCINFYSAGADADERRYAQLAAQRAGCELVERFRQGDVSLEPLRWIHRSGAPVNYWYYLDNHRDSVAFARERGAAAVFSGAIGDQLFYQTRASFAAGDYIRRHGLRPALFHVALDAARMDRISVWKVLREGLSQSLLGRRWNMTEEAAQFKWLLEPAVIEAVRQDERYLHPLLRAPGQAASGKLWHAASLLFGPEFYSPIGRPDDPDSVSPLNSQPLLELSLRTPTYLLTRGGWDRAVARRAFQHEMPREIAIRRTKGGMEEYVKAIFLRNMSLIRELLMDGFLVREKILDARKLKEVLSGEPTRMASGTVELFDYLSAEAWLRRWHEPRRREAA